MADNLLKQAILTLIGAHGRADLDPVRSFNIAAFKLVDMQMVADIAQEKGAHLSLCIAMADNVDCISRLKRSPAHRLKFQNLYERAQEGIHRDNEHRCNGGM